METEKIDHTELGKQIDALESVLDCRKFYDQNLNYQACIRIVRAEQAAYIANYPNLSAVEAREKWCKLYAFELSRDTKWGWSMNNCRKTACRLLYRVCDTAEANNDSEEAAYQEIADTFGKQRLNQILLHFLPMDRSNALFNMINTFTSERGLGWYSKGEEALYQALEDPPLELNPEKPTINKRLRKIQKYIYPDNEVYGRWFAIAAPPERGVKPVAAQLSVVHVGLWNPRSESYAHVGSGYIADAKSGLIVTASHVVYNVEAGANFGQIKQNLEDVVIGIAEAEVGGDRVTRYKAVPRYVAKIVASDVDNVDACVLQIHSKIVKGNPMNRVPIDPDLIEGENLPALKMTTTYSTADSIRSFGYNQEGNGIYAPGAHINYEMEFAPGKIIGELTPSTAQGVGPWHKPNYQRDVEMIPRRVIKVSNTTFVGQSGGPCLNDFGDCIGILSQGEPEDRRISYIAPVTEYKQMLVNLDCDHFSP